MKDVMAWRMSDSVPLFIVVLTIAVGILNLLVISAAALFLGVVPALIYVFVMANLVVAVICLHRFIARTRAERATKP